MVREVWLFDWGNTLMVDFPEYSGRMCDWPRVAAVDGAVEALQCLNRSHRLYVATGAADSSAKEIEQALERVGLSPFISGCFCQENLGIGKGSKAFYAAILRSLQVEPAHVTMVGDDYGRDIRPALEAGLNAVWFHPAGEGEGVDSRVRRIGDLRELCR